MTQGTRDALADAVTVYLLGSAVLVDGKVSGYVADGDTDSGYGLMIRGRRYECDAPNSNGYAYAVLAE